MPVGGDEVTDWARPTRSATGALCSPICPKTNLFAWPTTVFPISKRRLFVHFLPPCMALEPQTHRCWGESLESSYKAAQPLALAQLCLPARRVPSRTQSLLLGTAAPRAAGSAHGVRFRMLVHRRCLPGPFWIHGQFCVVCVCICVCVYVYMYMEREWRREKRKKMKFIGNPTSSKPLLLGDLFPQPSDRWEGAGCVCGGLRVLPRRAKRRLAWIGLKKLDAPPWVSEGTVVCFISHGGATGYALLPGAGQEGKGEQAFFCFVCTLDQRGEVGC